MPDRIIRKSICTSESLSSLSWFEQVLFIRLIVSVDDYGRFDARPQIIKGQLFPFDDVTVKQIQNAITRLSTNGMVSPYKVDGKPYLVLCAWRKYNTPRAKESKYPAPPEQDEVRFRLQTDVDTCKQEDTDAPDIRYSEFDIRYSGDSVAPAPKSKKFVAPSVEDVREYCRKNGYRIEPERFVDYYESNGWKVGKNPMKSWEAAVRNWNKSEQTGSNPARYGKKGIPQGASGELGAAELEAIQRVLQE